ncbi:MAG: carbon monoxide dehydrogenase subunit G [Candidatus Latescibacterota bacterium]|jgi:carbon monoxide dehydrogenase subunit G
MGCYNSAIINAPAEKVWAALRDFHNLDACSNVAQKLDKVGDTPGNQIGAQRVINDAFHETLVALDDQARSFRYSIDDGPGATAKDNVAGYIGEVQVFSVTDENKSFVSWASSWESSGSEDVAAFCNPIYQALLGDLKATFA